MASLRRKSGSRYWFACFTLPDGRQTQRSTKQTSRSAAQKVADCYERATRTRMAEVQIRRVMADLFEQISGEPLASSSIRDYIAQFLSSKRRELSKATFIRYQQLLGRFGTQLGDRINRDLNYITVADITRFRDSFGGMHPATANVALRMIRSFLQSAWKAGLVPENVGSKVGSMKVAHGNTRRAFTIPELQAILNAAGDSEWRGIILFGLYTGARLGDIAILTWQNVHGVYSKSPELRFVTRKTGRQQILPLVGPLVRYLLESIDLDRLVDPLFPRAYRVVSAQGRVGTLSNWFHDIMVNAGVVGARIAPVVAAGGRCVHRQPSELSFHCLRHTATSLLKSAGVGASVAMDIIGHDSTSVSTHYTHTTEDEKRAALNRLPDLSL